MQFRSPVITIITKTALNAIEVFKNQAERVTLVDKKVKQAKSKFRKSPSRQLYKIWISVVQSSRPSFCFGKKHMGKIGLAYHKK